VQEVAVVGIQDGLLGETIHASIVVMQDAQIDRLSIQRYCKKNLAIYKIPKTIDFVDSLPKTSSGKVQKHILRKAISG
jgi:non-ribosomal peptide synthetase component E (peptide arylation enzyme)